MTQAPEFQVLFSTRKEVTYYDGSVILLIVLRMYISVSDYGKGGEISAVWR